MNNNKQENLNAVIVALLIMIPIAFYMFWYSSQMDKLLESCKPNFELQICEFPENK